MRKHTELKPLDWLNKLVSSYPRLSDYLLDGAPSDVTAGLMKSLAERFEAFDLSLGARFIATNTQFEPSDVRVARTILGSLKKFRGSVEGVSTADLEQAAFARYESNNEAASANQIPWQYVDHMRRFLSRVLSKYSETDGVVAPCFGPGAVEEGHSQVYRWRRLFSFGDLCEEVPYFAADPGDMTVLHEACKRNWQGVGPSCRLHAVPKDWNKLRLITIEPYANTYLQAYVRERIRCAWRMTPGLPRDLVALGDPQRVNPQRRHQRLALEGSVDGSLATLDLSDASDLISYDQVATVMPSEVMVDLDRSRTWTYVRPDRPTQDPKKVYMYGGMGNGTTFVVETMMFHAASYAVAEHFGVPARERRISCYGDDIICGPRLAKLLVEEFKRFGWKINVLKSYYDEASRFRESCGVQAFNGEDVTLLRFAGGKTGNEALEGEIDLVRRCCRVPVFTPLVTEPWPNLAEVPNSPYRAIPGSLTTSVPWWPDTMSSVKSRYLRTVQKTQYRVPTAVRSSVTVSSTGLGLVYGALSGQLSEMTGSSAPDVFRRTGSNREAGTLRIPLRKWSGIEDRWRDASPDWSSAWWPLEGNADDTSYTTIAGDNTSLPWKEADESGTYTKPSGEVVPRFTC